MPVVLYALREQLVVVVPYCAIHSFLRGFTSHPHNCHAPTQPAGAGVSVRRAVNEPGCVYLYVYMYMCVCVYVYIYIYTWASTATLPRNRSPIYRKQKGLLSLLSLHAAWRVSFRECYSTPVSHVTIPLSKLTRGAPKASSHFVSAIELLFIT